MLEEFMRDLYETRIRGVWLDEIRHLPYYPEPDEPPGLMLERARLWAEIQREGMGAVIAKSGHHRGIRAEAVFGQQAERFALAELGV